MQEKANGRTDSSHPQADSAPDKASNAAHPEAPGTHAQTPQQCQPLFPDARGPRTVLDLMPKDWDRPFSGWACAYDASLGISHASQAYIRKTQWLRHRRPSMRRGAPQAQLRFSSWEVSPSSHGSQACQKAVRGSVHTQTVVQSAGIAVAAPAWAASDQSTLILP